MSKGLCVKGSACLCVKGSVCKERLCVKDVCV